jgi:precorrin-6B methylase 2
VPLRKDRDKITIKYSFWTNNYTNFVRTKIVPVEVGKTYDVDMTKEDPDNRDHVEPVFIPTKNDVAEQMCKLANVAEDDVVWDIGCGDGRMVITAVKKFGAKKGVGIDINPDLIATCKSSAKKEGVADRVEFKVGDALKLTDVSEATVVLLYLGEDLNLRLRPVLQKTLKPGARLVSNRFLMGDWKPDQSTSVEGYDYEIHLWKIKGKEGQ